MNMISQTYQPYGVFQYLIVINGYNEWYNVSAKLWLRSMVPILLVNVFGEYIQAGCRCMHLN